MWGAFINDTDHYSFSLLLCRRQEWMPSTEEAKKRIKKKKLDNDDGWGYITLILPCCQKMSDT